MKMSCKVSKSATVILTKLLNKVGTRNFRTKMKAPSPRALRIFIGPHILSSNSGEALGFKVFLPFCRLIQKTGVKSYNMFRSEEGLQNCYNVVRLLKQDEKL